MGFTHLQIECNPWLEGYRPQIPVLSALCPQLNLLNAPLPEKIPGYTTAIGYIMHHQFNIQQLYTLPTLYLCVLYLSENK
jgi:hypothetical protein